LPADGQLAGSPSALFDAIALVVSDAGCADLLGDAAAREFVSTAFTHLKAIGFTPQARALLDLAGVIPDAGVVEIGPDAAAFIPPARTRIWAREPSVRLLA
jgi:catalase